MSNFSFSIALIFFQVKKLGGNDTMLISFKNFKLNTKRINNPNNKWENELNSFQKK
jgi:hypothetical protein